MTRGNYQDKNGKDKPARRSGTVERSYDAAFRGFINLSLSEDEKGSFEAWFASASFWEVLKAQVADGVSVSVKVNQRDGGFIASAQQRRVDSPNAGLVVTARGREVDVALGRVVFVLALLSHGERWEDVQPIADPDRW